MGCEVDTKTLRAMQEDLSSKVILKDMFGDLKSIGGVDLAYKGNLGVCIIAIFDYKRMEQEHIFHLYDKVDFPYIPGFLSFREGPLIKKLYARLEQKPDMLLVNGNGILHPRFIGLASHIGVELDIPTIGGTQHLLCGNVKEDGRIYMGKRQVGYAYSKDAHHPIYISPGHKVSLKSSLKIVKRCITGHKLPEPLYIADKLSKQLIQAN